MGTKDLNENGLNPFFLGGGAKIWSILRQKLLKKTRTHLDLLSILQSGGKNVKTFRWDQRLQKYKTSS